VRILDKAEQVVAEGNARSILDLHFMYMAMIQANYADRENVLEPGSRHRGLLRPNRDLTTVVGCVPKGAWLLPPKPYGF